MTESAQQVGKVYRAIELLGVLALLVGVSLFIGSVPEDALWTIKAASITCVAGFLLYGMGRVGAWKKPAA